MYALSDSIRQTVRDFRSEFTDWEDEVRVLFHDVDRFLAKDGRPDGASAVASVAEDVAGLKGLVEQQTEVLTALVNALMAQSAAAEMASASHSSASAIDPFERLQQAVAAASEAA